jgi:hypothetical protein
MMDIRFLFVLLFAAESVATNSAAQSPITRRYSAGDSIAYHMTGVNAGRSDTARYTADVAGNVVRDSVGGFVEHLAWTNLIVNGHGVSLPLPGSPRTAQHLSLSPRWRPTADTRGLAPELLAPVLDLLTFYVDLQLAGRLPALAKPGDHAFLPLSVSPTWGDGITLLRGQDAIDFDVTLTVIDTTANTASVVVRHVPPAKPVIDFPASWMDEPIGSAPNNWLQVSKLPNGRYSGAAGRETFDVVLTVSTRDGRLTRATMSNPVDVIERVCTDAKMTECDSPVRYRIMRDISVTAAPTG